MTQRLSPPDAVQTARASALDWLMGRINFERTAHIPYQERQLKLDRMRQLLTHLGQPDAGLKIVHVAGTKGKGSTSAMIAGILTAAGYRTGVFSSPHLEQIEERFAVDAQPCTAAELAALVDRLRPVVRAMDDQATADGDPTGGPTYFEVTTAMALVHFAERAVDAAVLEVGLGGRLDSTNVCLPVVSVITSISFDHTRQLGNTLAQIAREKAGIVKPGVPVVCGVTDPEPQAVIAEIAREHGCRLIQLGRDFQFTYRRAASSPTPNERNDEAQITNDEKRPSPSFVIRHSSFVIHNEQRPVLDFTYIVPGQEFELANLPLAMRGPHQAANAAVALATIAELRHQGWCISDAAMRGGLADSALPGRVEVFAGDPTVVLDAAHNPAAAQALINALAEMPAPTRRTLILSISRDKDVRAIIRVLAPHFDRFVATQYQDNPRAILAEQLANLIRDAIDSPAAESVAVVPLPHEAWQSASQTAQPGELICITGSFYLAAEMRPILCARHMAGPFWMGAE